MPVEDKPVHPLTRLTTDLHGCNNAEFRAGYWAPDREYHVDGTFDVKQTWIPRPFADGCEWKKTHESERCKGCVK